MGIAACMAEECGEAIEYTYYCFFDGVRVEGLGTRLDIAHSRVCTSCRNNSHILIMKARFSLHCVIINNY